MDLRPSPRRANLIAGMICALSVAALTAGTFVAAPLYRIFSDVTGYNGTVRVAAAGPKAGADAVITVLFDTNLGNGLEWRFRPMSRSMTVKLGEVAHATFVAENRSQQTITATALPIVAPTGASRYFRQLDCFCTAPTTLHAGEQAELNVSFFVDPAYARDSELETTSTITLSYTLYPAPTPSVAR